MFSICKLLSKKNILSIKLINFLIDIIIFVDNEIFKNS